MSANANAFPNPVMAAVETCATRRWREAAPAAPSQSAPDVIGRTVAIIDAAAEKIEADDFSSVASALMSQALSLDAIFEAFVRRAACGEVVTPTSMNMALRAQSQSRVTFKNLVALKNPRAPHNLIKRTIETAKIPA